MNAATREKVQEILNGILVLLVAGFIAWSLMNGCALSKTV